MILFQEGSQACAADFLFPFDDKGQVAGQRSACFEISFDRFKVGEVLTFVVARAAGEDRTAFNARLKGRRFPQFEWFGRLDIVMAVNKETGPVLAVGFDSRSFGNYDGVARRRAKAGFQADGLAVLHNPFGAGLQVLPMFGLGGDAGETEVIAQLVNGTSFVFFEVIKDSLHAQSFSREKTGSKSDQSMNH